MSYSTSQNPKHSQPSAWFKGPRLDYKGPPRMCRCPVPSKAAMWVSETNMNPGRRFFRCVKGRDERRCNYFEWFDDAFTPWSAELINGLRRDKSRLKRDLKMLRDYGCEECKEARISQRELIDSSCAKENEMKIALQSRRLNRLRMLLGVSWVGFIVYFMAS